MNWPFGELVFEELSFGEMHGTFKGLSHSLRHRLESLNRKKLCLASWLRWRLKGLCCKWQNFPEFLWPRAGLMKELEYRRWRAVAKCASKKCLRE